MAALSQAEERTAPELSHGEDHPVAALSQWLHLMLGEIARKRAELEQERAEAARRELERAAGESQPSPASAIGVHGRTD
jgi:hypothetical protein